ncbi:MAG: SpoIIE family protein phosphatase [Hamadaea sp.]|uniref:protein phosphatase 2C domain-containing protein n=1 Tax=Hamadaea sp. TaxID=2024425 RepID=UPI0017A00D14|nr:protein phosphatase 2C domain-containing protein [Hamadaea sp.]NUT22250.1 SpoIIE family protein phosphatase [Hamadaea sp.]
MNQLIRACRAVFQFFAADSRDLVRSPGRRGAAPAPTRRDPVPPERQPADRQPASERQPTPDRQPESAGATRPDRPWAAVKDRQTAAEPADVWNDTAAQDWPRPSAVVRAQAASPVYGLDAGPNQPDDAAPDPDPVVPTPPRLGEPSKLTGLPWELPTSPAQPGVAADEARLGTIEVRAASVVGPGHRHAEERLPRQDAYRLGRTHDGEYLIAAVADGVGTAARADLGATVAVTTAVTYLKERLDHGTAPALLDGEELFTYVAGAIADQARQRGIATTDVATTLLVAVVGTRPGVRDAWVAAVGDSPAFRRRHDGWLQIAGDTKESGDNRVDGFLPHRPGSVRVALARLAPGDVLALVSDGVGDPIAKFPSVATWFARRWRTPSSAMSLVLDVCFELRAAQDDRTAVVLWIDPVQVRRP